MYAVYYIFHPAGSGASGHNKTCHYFIQCHENNIWNNDYMYIYILMISGQILLLNVF